MEEILKSVMFGAGSMEGRFLALIAALDLAETLVATSAEAKEIDPEIFARTAQLKQDVIEAFAAANARGTLASNLKAAARMKEQSTE
jgi:hypothetical protein